MNAHFQRGLLLFQQSRFEQAQEALRQALATEPEDAYAHALLALCLTEREQFREATEHAQRAIALAPDFPFAHYALARVAYDRNTYDEAAVAIREAIRLGPGEPDYRALSSAMHFDQGRWQDALAAAEEGLQLDAEHAGCANLRAMAQVKLGRRREAGATIDATLAKDPENAISHANRGWAWLEHHDTARALEHFREALRLDPGNTWAREGLVEALKARHVVYAAMLRYFLWMSKLSSREQWGVILLGALLFRLLAWVIKTTPELAPLALLAIPYFGFVVLTWTAKPLFNLILRLDRFGRLALSQDQLLETNLIGGLILLSLLSAGTWVMTGFASRFLAAALVFGVLIIPLAGTFRCFAGWPRQAMWVYTGFTAALGVAGLVLVFAGLTDGPLAPLVWGFFFLSLVGSTWVANILMGKRPRR